MVAVVLRPSALVVARDTPLTVRPSETAGAHHNYKYCANPTKQQRARTINALNHRKLGCSSRLHYYFCSSPKLLSLFHSQEDSIF